MIDNVRTFDFKKNVLDRSAQVPVLVEFASPGCGPCLWMEKTLIDTTRKLSGKIEFVSISITDHPELQDEYQLKSNPTTILFQKGKESGRLNGALPQMVVEQWINDLVV